MKQTTILVYEPEATGHQMELLRYFVEKIDRDIANPRIILLTTQEAADHPNCLRLVADFSHVMRVHIAPPVTRRNIIFRFMNPFYERQWQSGEMLAIGLDAIGPANVDFVLIPHLEAIGLLQLGLRPSIVRGRPWATLSVGVRFHHRQLGIKGPSHWQDHIQRWFFNRVIRHPQLACFGAVNPYLAQAIHHPKVVWCPEPAPAAHLTSPDIARKAYGIRRETCVVLVFGFISRRKCVDLLLQAVAQLDPALDVTVFLAGTQHSGHMKPILESPIAENLRARGRLVEANRYIMVGPDIDPMSVADISWVYYEKNFVYTGNVLVRSALAGRAVICRDQGVIGRLVSERQCGLVLDSEQPDAIAAAIATLAQDPALRDKLGTNGAQAFAGNTPDLFAQPIVASIARTIGQR